MKDFLSVSELRVKLGAPSSASVESLRLLKAFYRLAPAQRFEVMELVEQLARDSASDRQKF